MVRKMVGGSLKNMLRGFRDVICHDCGQRWTCPDGPASRNAR